MAINYPNSLDNFTNPTSSSPINSPSHADQHSNANDAIEALEAKVGVTGSAVSTSHDYKITQLESLVTSAVAGAKSIYQDVRNQSGSSLSKATPVYASGSEGASGKILVSPASNSAESSSSKTIGLTSSAISNNSNGQIISEGILEGVDTTGAVDGDPVWLGPNGTKIFGLVNKPSAPSHLVFLGIVVRGGQANTGSIYVKIQNGFELQELHNVQISSLLNGNIIAYDSTSETWKNTNTLQSTASTVPLVIKGSASQSVNIFEVQNASGYPMVFVDAYGALKAQASGMYVNSGYASGTGIVVRGYASQTADLQQWQNSSGTVLSRVRPDGQIGIGSTLITGTNFFVNNTISTTNVVATIRGAASQTADLQQWQDSAGSVKALIGSGGNGVFNGLRSGSGSTTGAINAYTTAAQVGILVRGAASQTANLQEWQDSAGTVLVRVTNSGVIGTSVGVYSPIYQGNNGVGGAITFANATAITITPQSASVQSLIVKGAASQTANLTEWQNSDGTVLANIASTGQINADAGIYAGFAAVGTARIGTAHLSVSSQYFGNPVAVIQGISSQSATVLTVKAGASQTANLQEWQNDTGTVLSSIKPDGSLFVVGNSNTKFISGPSTSGTNQIVSNGNDLAFSPYFDGLFAPANAAGRWRPVNDATSDLGTSGQRWKDVYATSAVLNNNSISKVGLIVKAIASQTANLQEWQNSSGYVYASIDSAGSFNLASGKQVIFNTGLGTRLNFGYGSSYVVGIDDYAIAFGVENSTGLGKIAVRPATATYGSSYINPIELYGNGQIKQNLTIPSNVGLSIKAANSQTANLQEWQDSSGNTLVSVQANGYIQGSYINLTSGGGILSSSSNQLYANSGSWLIVAPGPTKNGLIIKGAASQSADLQQWQNSAGEVQVSIKATSNLTNVLKFTEQFSFAINWGNEPILSTSSGELVVSPYGPERAALIVKGKTSQTDNLQEWQNSSGQIRASISSTGGLSLNYANSIKLYNTANTDYASLWMDNGSGGVNLYTKTNYPIIIGNTGVDNGANLTSASTSASSIPLVIQHAASPTSSYFEIRNSSGTAIWGINSVGEALTRTTTKFGANIQNDSSNNNTALSISAPSSGGTGIALYVYSGSATRDIAKFDNSGTVKLTITSDGSLKGGNSSTISANTATTVDTVALSSFTTIEYVVSIKQGSKIRSSKVLVHTDGTSVDSTEYGIMEMGGGITGILVTASVSSTNSILEVTITDAATTNATVKLIKTML